MKLWSILGEREDYCKRLCRTCMHLMGIRRKSIVSLWSILMISSLILSTLCCLYACLGAGNCHLEIFHHFMLNLIANGLAFAFYLWHEELTTMAGIADQVHDYGDPTLVKVHAKNRAEAHNSLIVKLTAVFCFTTVLLWLSVLSQNAKDLSHPPSGLSLPWGIHPLVAHLIETMFIISAVLVDLIVLVFFVVICTQLSAQMRTLSHALVTFHKRSGSVDSSVLKKCIIHHQEIIRGFEMLKAFYEVVFHFIYFGIIWAIAFCRSLLLEDHIDFATLGVMLIAEINYLFLFCNGSDQLSLASEQVRLAAYSSEWINLPKSMASSIQFVIARTAKPPLIRLFVGGSFATQETIITVLHATMTYFMVSILLK